MSTERMTVEEMIGEASATCQHEFGRPHSEGHESLGGLFRCCVKCGASEPVSRDTANPFVVIDGPLPALEDVTGPLEPEHPVNADAPQLHALTVQGCSAHKVAAYINTQLPEFVPDVVAIQFGMHSNVVILRARPSMVEKARAEGRW